MKAFSKVTMDYENWHKEFNPKKFLDRVNLKNLLERNELFNEMNNCADSEPLECILCRKKFPKGLILNDKSFLCEHCYSEVALISYPEKYEQQRRSYLIEKESRKIAWEEFEKKYKYNSDESVFSVFGFLSIILLFVNLKFLILTALLFFVGHLQNEENRLKVRRWQHQKETWEQDNLPPVEPELRHFHDPRADLTHKDYLILKIFNHWPGYPPFWKYLRQIILNKDSNRCQVSGCPSRLELHVHHMKPVAMGGSHSPDNLVSLCDFHHALEPDKGHEKIWGEIKSRYFTLIDSYERNNRSNPGTHLVRSHLRRQELITLEDLRELTKTFGFRCPNCRETKIIFTLSTTRNTILVECPRCNKFVEGPQLLAEESGPKLAEILEVTRNKGRWKARWDMLEERKDSDWGAWSPRRVSEVRKDFLEKIDNCKSAPLCPKCGSTMRLVKPRPCDTWQPFWGCSQFRINGCKGSMKLKKADENLLLFE